MVAEPSALGQQAGWLIPDTVVLLTGYELGQGRCLGENLCIVKQRDSVTCLQLKSCLTDALFFATWPLEPHRTFLHGVFNGYF